MGVERNKEQRDNMQVREAIDSRRAFRALAPVQISREIIMDLAKAASLSPSCFNHQPWRYIFVHDPDWLDRLKDALSRGNNWARKASLIIAVCSREDYDCVIDDRKMYQFDTGMATAFLILRATELGMVAHPIAGYSDPMVREVLGIPHSTKLICLVVVGKHDPSATDKLSEKQKESENQRPGRKAFREFCSMDEYGFR